MRKVLFSVEFVCVFGSLFVWLDVCQHDNSSTVRNIITKFSGHHPTIKRADKFENCKKGCMGGDIIPLCTADMMQLSSGVAAAVCTEFATSWRHFWHVWTHLPTVGGVSEPIGSRRELVANCVHTADATQLDSCVASVSALGISVSDVLLSTNNKPCWCVLCVETGCLWRAITLFISLLTRERLHRWPRRSDDSTRASRTKTDFSMSRTHRRRRSVAANIDVRCCGGGRLVCVEYCKWHMRWWPDVPWYRHVSRVLLLVAFCMVYIAYYDYGDVAAIVRESPRVSVSGSRKRKCVAVVISQDFGNLDCLSMEIPKFLEPMSTLHFYNHNFVCVGELVSSSLTLKSYSRKKMPRFATVCTRKWEIVGQSWGICVVWSHCLFRCLASGAMFVCWYVELLWCYISNRFKTVILCSCTLSDVVVLV